MLDNSFLIEPATGGSGGDSSSSADYSVLDDKFESNYVATDTIQSNSDVVIESVKVYLEIDVDNATSLTFATPTSTFVGNGYLTILNGSSLSSFGSNTTGLDSETFTNKDTFAYLILDGVINFKRVV